MDYKPLTTTLIPNLKLSTYLDLDLVDQSMYRQLIGSLMHLVNTKPDIYFVVNTLSQYMFDPR
jgi:hypothetical protein